MDYITAAEKWAVTPRRVKMLCRQGQIKATKMGMTVSGVKQSLTAIGDKLGVRREDFAAYL